MTTDANQSLFTLRPDEITSDRQQNKNKLSIPLQPSARDVEPGLTPRRQASMNMKNKLQQEKVLLRRKAKAVSQVDAIIALSSNEDPHLQGTETSARGSQPNPALDLAQQSARPGELNSQTCVSPKEQARIGVTMPMKYTYLLPTAASVRHAVGKYSASAPIEPMFATRQIRSGFSSPGSVGTASKPCKDLGVTSPHYMNPTNASLNKKVKRANPHVTSNSQTSPSVSSISSIYGERKEDLKKKKRD